MKRKSLPRATCDWALDSGGFTELNMYGGWQTTPKEYIAAARRYRAEIGRLVFAAPQDWMCEPPVLARTGGTVVLHQERTVANYLTLREAAPEVPWIPVLQGWTVGDYLRCCDLYERRGVALDTLPTVGVGTVCRRQSGKEGAAIVTRLAAEGLRLHGFGFKITGLRAVGDQLASADSMAWSYAARRQAPLPGCTGHINCANCLRYATKWRARLVETAD
jgi:hypothetical protein